VNGRREERGSGGILSVIGALFIGYVFLVVLVLFGADPFPPLHEAVIWGSDTVNAVWKNVTT
jgi:hypothetical protein